MKYLLTGGGGYIGLHVALAIKNSGHDVLLADNFSNSNPKFINSVNASNFVTRHARKFLLRHQIGQIAYVTGYSL